MENLFEELLKENNLKNFTYNWLQKYEKNYETLISTTISTKPESETIFESLKLFIKKANQFNFENFTYDEVRNHEELFSYVTNRLIQKIDFKTYPDVNKTCIEFIGYCLNEKNLMIFNGITLKKFLSEAKDSALFSKFSLDDWNQVIILLKSSSFFILGKELDDELIENNKEYNQYKSSLYSIWQNVFVNLIEYMSHEMFVQNLISLQDLYE
jgi:hypothetical protein